MRQPGSFQEWKMALSNFWIQAEDEDGLDDGAEPQAPKDWRALHQIASCASSWPQPGENHSYPDPRNYFGTKPLLLWRLQATFSALRKMTVFPEIKWCPHPIKEVWAPVNLKGLTARGNICPQHSSLWTPSTPDPPQLLFSQPMAFPSFPCFLYRILGAQSMGSVNGISKESVFA